MEALLGQPERFYGTCDRGLPSRRKSIESPSPEVNEFYSVTIDSETGDFHPQITDGKGRVLRG